MTADEIKRAILDIKARELHNGTNMRLRNIHCTIYQALQNELERIENKPLTIEQLKGMIGEPVWYCYKHMTTIPFIIKDLIFSSLLNANVLVTSENQKIVLGENTFFCKYKPQEG